MKRLLWIPLIFLCSTLWAADIQLAKMNPYIAGAGVAAAAPAAIAGSSAFGSASGYSVSVALGASTSSGQLLVAMFTTGTKDPATQATLSDNRANSWTKQIETAGTSLGRSIYTAVAKDAGVVTVTLEISQAADLNLAVVAFSGLTNAADGAGAQAAASSTDAHAGSIETSVAGVIVGLVTMGSATTYTADGNWTLIGENEAGYGMSACYRLTSAGTYNDGWTTGTSAWWGATTFAFK